jgi:pyridoxamine 5'-phosphate oxidase
VDPGETGTGGGHPLRLLEEWLAEASGAGEPQADTVAFVTVGGDGRPTARTVRLKRVEEDALLFSSALWTRKARELRSNPSVALLFHWPALGRQVHVCGRAEVAERALAVELFDERDLANRVQTLVSRQGEAIEDLEVLRARHGHLMKTLEAPPPCPPDWGAIRVLPDAIEFWRESADRMHERLLHERGEAGWSAILLAP